MPKFGVGEAAILAHPLVKRGPPSSRRRSIAANTGARNNRCRDWRSGCVTGCALRAGCGSDAVGASRHTYSPDNERLATSWRDAKLARQRCPRRPAFAASAARLAPPPGASVSSLSPARPAIRTCLSSGYYRSKPGTRTIPCGYPTPEEVRALVSLRRRLDQLQPHRSHLLQAARKSNWILPALAFE